MKPFIILLPSLYLLAFGSGCMKVQSDNINTIDASVSIENTSPLNLDNRKLDNDPIYNLDNLTAGFVAPIKQNNHLIFVDKFIDGEFKDIDYLDKNITIKNCNDLLTHDLRETLNIAKSDRDILLTRKRSCLLVKEITDDTNVLAFINHYENSDFIPIANKKLKDILDSIPSKVSENREVDCSIDQYHNVVCLDKQEPKEYSLYINQVAVVDDKNYYFITVNTAVPTYYYLTTIDGEKIDSQWIYY